MPLQRVGFSKGRRACNIIVPSLIRDHGMETWHEWMDVNKNVPRSAKIIND